MKRTATCSCGQLSTSRSEQCGRRASMIGFGCRQDYASMPRVRCLRRTSRQQRNSKGRGGLKNELERTKH